MKRHDKPLHILHIHQNAVCMDAHAELDVDVTHKQIDTNLCTIIPITLPWYYFHGFNNGSSYNLYSMSPML